MSEYLSAYKKRPKSRSEELARYAKAENNLDKRVQKLTPPRTQTLFERIQGHFIEKARNEQDK